MLLLELVRVPVVRLAAFVAHLYVRRLVRLDCAHTAAGLDTVRERLWHCTYFFGGLIESNISLMQKEIVEKLFSACVAEACKIAGEEIKIEAGRSTTWEGNYAIDISLAPEVSIMFFSETEVEFFDETSGVMRIDILRIDDPDTVPKIAKAVVLAQE